MTVGPSIIRRPTSEKSNTELTNSLISNINSSQQAFAPATNGVKHSAGENLAGGISSKIPYRKWSARDNDALYIPAIDFSTSGLAEERSQYDITVKLFFLPNTLTSTRKGQTQEAIDLVLRELHVPSIDLLIVSFPGVSFDADDEEELEPGIDAGEGSDLDAMVETWRALEDLHAKGIAKQIGLAEFGSDRLQRFLPRTRIKPSVDQINVRDCCVVPKTLILYAKQEKIELLTHNDCTNILPKGTVRELLGPGKTGAGVLTGPNNDSDGLKGEIKPQWVVKYTAVVQNRGVIENKGYFAMADIET